MRYEFHPEALEEYNEAAFHYARKEPGLDLRFILSVESAIEAIVQDPLRWRQIDEDVRRCLTRVFPYGLLYTIEADYVLIVAVAHCSREPGYWKHRIA
ncbi:MAG TPA: type II toxin-antitoxin system RelE/ParE family toxin [Verrucomicrobiae bacterium]|jgi:plasmid stabilization system protein ParE|nr:type II toxin-antitoxin system RelE/ParE family toxin [Verrucomicrobiae bacterium]